MSRFDEFYVSTPEVYPNVGKCPHCVDGYVGNNSCRSCRGTGRKIDSIIVSRHPAAIQFIREEAGLPEDTLIVASATKEDVINRKVYGNLPLSLAQYALVIVAVEFEGAPPRGLEYSIEDMRAAGAKLSEYFVRANAENVPALDLQPRYQ